MILMVREDQRRKANIDNLMKIEISNFGPVRHFSFDIEKEMHLIVGENNIGKSYAITLTYLVLKSLLRTDELLAFQPRISDPDDVSLPGEVSSLAVYSETSVTDYVRRLTSHHLNAYLISFLNQSFVGTYEKPEITQSFLTQEPFTLKLSSSLVTLILSLENKELCIREIALTKTYYARKLTTHRIANKSAIKDVLHFKEGEPLSVLKDELSRLSLSIVSSLTESVSRQIRSVHFLPASRSGLYQALNAFGQIVAELSKSRAFISRKIELPGISEPLSDYFLRLSEISTSTQGASSSYSLIADNMEKEILKGRVEFDSKSKKITYQPFNSQLKLELSSTSSMVSELSPIVSYIRYVLPDDRQYFSLQGIGYRRRRGKHSQSKALLFIEEPEAHLHPKAQLALVQIFSELLQAGVKLVVTTHSNYLFNELSNKVLSGDVNPNKIVAFQLVMTPDGSVDNSLVVDELGIEDRNFVTVSEELLNERLAVVERINESTK